MNVWPIYTATALNNDGVLLIEDGNHGEYRPRKWEFSDFGCKFIRAADMKNGLVQFSTAESINEAAIKRIRKGIGRDRDVILSHKGTVGKVAYVPPNSPSYVCSPQTTFWRCLAPNRLDPRYLYAYLCSPHFQQQLFSRANESDMAGYVSLTVQRKLTVALPPINEQKAIAHILGTLDDKIELNRQTNKTLESIAKAIFKSWFVDFDPVKAKRDGKTADLSLSPDILDLFPDSFQDSEIGKIPAGWEVHEIGRVIDAVGGGTPSTKNTDYWENGNIHWATPKDMSTLEDPVLIDTARYLTPEGLNKISSGLLPVGTVLLSSRAPVGYLAIARIPMAVNQGFIALKCNRHFNSYYAINWCESNMSVIESRASGTTFLEISKRNFKSIPALVPILEVMEIFEKYVGPYYNKIESNCLENITLSELRDTLLPKLISGELRIKDAEKFLKDAPL